MRTLSLFSGIGGLDLGLERAGFQIVAQCEQDPFCRAVLAKHWPGVPCHNDVNTLDPSTCGPLDAIVGGFPCQDVSNAGHRAGISGSRSGLYGQVVRCLRVVRPRLGVLENVAALLARGMGVVLGDLAEIGYDAEWDCLPASACGALHHRDRVFIIASVRSDAGSVRSQGFRAPKEGPWTWEQLEGLVQAELRVSVPAGKSGGVADGLPDRMGCLRALGNAVVPQVAEVVGAAVMSMEAAR
jgi:DNA (cytosine-5)-methyltransferase 1